MATQPERAPEPQREPKKEVVVVHEELEPKKSRLTAGLFSIFLGWLGIGRFYMGYTGLGILQIVITLLTGVGGLIWGIIEGIMILTKSFNYDAEGRPLKDD